MGAARALPRADGLIWDGGGKRIHKGTIDEYPFRFSAYSGKTTRQVGGQELAGNCKRSGSDLVNLTLD